MSHQALREAAAAIDRNLDQMTSALARRDCTEAFLASHRAAGGFGIAVANVVTRGVMTAEEANAALDARFQQHRKLMDEFIRICMGDGEPTPPRGSFLPPGRMLNGLGRRRRR